MKIVVPVILLSLLIGACTDAEKETDKTVSDSALVVQADSMRNGLVRKMNGQWVNTSLFDSTLNQKKLAPWIPEFYADLYLEITDSDTAIIKGNMDGGNTHMKIMDKNTFTFLERVDRPVFTYSSATDLITEKTSQGKILVFRRAKEEEMVKIIGNEELFNMFFIGHFFTDDYFKQKTKPEISDIWSGFLTYTPFTFDAIAVTNKQGEKEWYAWKFKGDTLELYNTTHTEDEESGFLQYETGMLKERYIKSK